MAPTPLPQLIAAAADRLTPTERRIAEAIVAEPTLLPFGTVTDLAAHVGTSRPSVVRFARKLGFTGYTELQEHARRGFEHRISRPSDRIRHDDPDIVVARAALEAAIAGVFEAADGERLAALADPIARAANVWIISGETSRAGAHALASGLTMIRPNVHLVEVHSMARTLAGAGPEDTAVVFDFLRYRRHTVTAARTLSGLGLEIVAITDGPLSPLAALAEAWCELKVPAVGPFDSSVPAVAMAELLVARVAHLLRGEAKVRIDLTEDLWAATETFLPQP